MAENKINARKYAAVALGIVGIAGLSLASAAQLDVNQESPLVGVGIDNGCDDTVNVAYKTAFSSASTPKFNVDTVEVSDIAAACFTPSGAKEITVYVLDGNGDTLHATAPQTITGATATIDISTAGVDAERVAQAAVSIN